MKILQILPELNVGGVETGTVDLAKYLIEHEHEALVISNGGVLVEKLDELGVKHFQLPVHKKSLPTMIRMVKAVRRILIEEDVDIIHARSRVPAWIAFFASRKTRTAFITTCHGYYKSPMFSQVMGWAKYVISPSEVIARHMIDDFKVPSTSLRIIPRSVDLDKFKNIKPQKKDPLIKHVAIVGRITPLKGHLYFIRAMAKVIRSMPNVKVWIIGDVPPKKENYKRELETTIRRFGITDQIEFLGNRQDVPELLAKTDVVVLSTVTQEAFGRVILEAQAASVPVVATQVGGVVDIIDHEQTGLLVMPKDTDAMAHAVMRILNNKDLAQHMVKEAKKKLRNKYTLEHMASQTLKVYEELLNSLNVLVIKISSVGDVVLVTASLKAIRKKYPHAQICCLVGKESRKILQNCPYIDELIIYDTRHDKGWFKLFKLSKKLRAFKFDKVIDFQNNRKSHFLCFASLCKESYGYDNGKWSSLLSNPVENKKKLIPPVEHQFQLLKALKIPMPKQASLELWISEKDREHANKLLDSEWLGGAKRIVGINIAASAKWKTKNWPIEHIARLCDLLSKDNIRIIITGMKKDQGLAQHLLKLTKAKPALLVGKTDVMQLAALISRCKVFLTPDSAPMHLAAATNTPFIVLYGPTDSRRHTPPAKKSIVIQKDLKCAPCYGAKCRILTHACMTEISPEEVHQSILNLMGVKV